MNKSVIMKIKLIFVLTLWSVNGFSQRIYDSFSWGAGVAGRETITTGAIINGFAIENGGGTWDVGNGTVVFEGVAGIGNGRLSMTGNNAVLKTDYSVTNQSGALRITVTGIFTPGASGVRGFFAGFQAVSPDNNLLNNQTSDKLFLQMNNSGGLTFRSVIGGVTNNATGSDSLTWNSGDEVTLSFDVDIRNKKAIATITAGNAVTRELSWTGENPDWNVFAVNQTGSSTLWLKSVEIRPRDNLRLILLH